MSIDIILSNNSDLPIYAQIVLSIKEKIAKGELIADTLMPSMRLLAKTLDVSVITTKRAYEELEREGFIYTIPSKGSYIAKRDEAMIHEYYSSQMLEALQGAVEFGKLGGVSKDQILDALIQLWEKGDK